MGTFLMDRSSYQSLRFSVECEVSSAVSDPVAASELVNAVMARVVTALADQQLAKHRIDETFKSFDRSLIVPLPKWAHKSKGKSPEYNPLR